MAGETNNNEGPYPCCRQKITVVAATATANDENHVFQDDHGQQRTIGYCIQPASNEEHLDTAILWFYPMSSASIIVEHAAASFVECNYKATVICVDRPGFGDTDMAPQKEASNSMDRIEQHAQDVLHVLKHHKEIKKVYLLGVCLGHVYAIQVARKLLQQKKNYHDHCNDNDEDSSSSLLELKGITLVAPFVSTTCPHAWRVARFGGHHVPTWVLSPATYCLVALGDSLMASFLTPAKIKHLLGETQFQAFGWTDDDCATVIEMVMEINQSSSRHARSLEANLGADPSWQCVMDEFALESGYGLQVDDVDDDDNNNNDDVNYNHKANSTCIPHGQQSDNRTATTITTVPPAERTTERKPPLIPLRIRVTKDDKIAPYSSIEWVARRCYGGSDNNHNQIHNESKRIPTHEGMIMLGGPPRNPVLLHEIAKEWGLVE